MKYVALFLLFWCSLFINAQSNPFKEDLILFLDCDTLQLNNECFEEKTRALILERIQQKDVNEIIKSSAKNVVEIVGYFSFDEKGNLLPEDSSLKCKTSADAESLGLDYVFNDFPKIYPRKDEIGNVGSSYIYGLFGFKIENSKLQAISDYEPEINMDNFTPLDSGPVYKVAETPSLGQNSTSSMRSVNYYFTKYIAKNFNIDLANQLGLSPGKKTIAAFFKVDKSGEIINIRARSSRMELEQEVIRIIKSIKKADKPAMSKGKPVVSSFVIPVRFLVE